ncbi:MAG: alcohol dehydrogenase catalytic domain-containing protein [Ignavibacteriae bacterium]|nr:alcohol dehydrogenase catalytic domain-containing protein [Ignavibacteriota bacterium]
MKAIVKPKPIEGERWLPGLRLVDKPEPEIESTTDVKIRVIAGAICGTDGGIYNSKESLRREMMKARKPEIILGHEFCGKVEDAGTKAKEVLAQLMMRHGKSHPMVKKFSGRRSPKQVSKDKKFLEVLGENFYCSAEMHITDGTCYQCRLGEKHVCQNTIIKGVHDDGAFTQYVVVPVENIVIFHNGEIAPEVIAFMDALGNATHTVQSIPIKGDTVAILGCGVQGLMATAVVKFAGAKKIYVTDASRDNFSHEKLVATRFRLARTYGADACFDVSVPEEHEAFVRRVMNDTNNTGVDAVYEMSGNYRAYEDAFRVVRMGGSISLLGLPSGVTSVDFAKDIIFRGVTIHGIIGRRVFETWDLMRDMLKKGLAQKFIDSGFITHDLPLERFEEGFAALRNGDALKVLLRTS